MIEQMTNTLEELENKLQSSQNNFDKVTKEKEKMLNDYKRIDEIVKQRDYLFKEDEEKHNKIEQLEDAKCKYEKDFHNLQKEKMSSQEQLNQVKTENRSYISSLETREDILKAKEEKHRKEIELLKAELEQQKNRNQLSNSDANLQQTEILKSQLELMENKNRDLQQQLLDILTLSNTIQKLKEELEHYNEIDKNYHRTVNELRFYKDTAENTEQLKSRIEDLQNKLVQSEQLSKDYIKLLAEHEQLKTKMQTNNVPSPLKAVPSAHILQKDNLLLTSKIGNLVGDLKTAQFDKTVVENKLQDLTREHDLLQSKYHTLLDDNTQKKKKLMLVTKQRDSLQEIVRSFENDDNLEDHKTKRINELEEVIKELETKDLTQEAEITNNITELTEITQKLKKEITQLQDEKNQLLYQLDLLKNENEKLSIQVESLEKRVTSGEYNKQTTRVLHLISNPESLAIKKKQEAEKDLLIKEIEALKETIKLIKESPTAQPTESVLTDITNNVKLKQEKEHMQKQLQELEKRNIRTKEVFHQKINEFREACYKLFGFKIDFFFTIFSTTGIDTISTSFYVCPK